VKSFSYEDLFVEPTPPIRKRTSVRRGKYDFGVAYPDPDFLPLEDLATSLKSGLLEDGRGLAIYPHPQGYPPLRELLAHKLAKERGIHVNSDDIILADGSSQAIHMVTEALVAQGDVVFTEEFVYTGTLVTLKRFHADVRGISCDSDGMMPDSLEKAIRVALNQNKAPKFIYTIPTFQNPLGWEMSLRRRQVIVEISQRYNVPILEDDCYVDVRYAGTPITSLHSLDSTGRVMYVASFSKTIAPGMRIGYLTAPSQVLDRVMSIKSGGGVNQFASLAVHHYAISHLDNHIINANKLLRIKRDAMVAALGENLGTIAKWTNPSGGLFVWLEMPGGIDLVEVEEKALNAGVSYLPGPLFDPRGVNGRNCARLCFGYNTPDEINEGIARLTEVFHREGFLA
jgi:2-aminoadipate transaminase